MSVKLCPKWVWFSWIRFYERLVDDDDDDDG